MFNYNCELTLRNVFFSCKTIALRKNFCWQSGLSTISFPESYSSAALCFYGYLASYHPKNIMWQCFVFKFQIHANRILSLTVISKRFFFHRRCTEIPLLKIYLENHCQRWMSSPFPSNTLKTTFLKHLIYVESYQTRIMSNLFWQCLQFGTIVPNNSWGLLQ